MATKAAMKIPTHARGVISLHLIIYLGLLFKQKKTNR
jgi:hypothetical protein